jgi:metallo-beta-lactamase family protein
MDIQFIGATGTVTGSKYLISSDSHRVLVDCGLFQGQRQLRDRNWEPLPINASEITSVLITHAHIDHTGYIPLLIKHGFRGKIYCSHGTAELCKLLLLDSGHLQEEDALYANKRGFSKHTPALPLYTRQDAEDSLKYFHPVDFEREVDLEGNLKFQLMPAGHILGSSLIKFNDGKTSILFTGDLGRPHDIMMRPPTIVHDTDYLVLESTYGNRLHSDIDPMIELAEVINRTSHRGGVTIIPAFAVGRAQAILYLIYMLKKEKKISDIPIYLDSPMAVDASDLYCKHASEHRLSEETCKLMCKVAKYINSPNESKALDQQQSPKVIISASGMATGGRVLHHMKAFITDRRNTILFTGFQAAGTRGEALVHGKNPIKIYGESIPVRAEIVFQDSLSAHSDYSETLEWLKHFQHPPKRVFLTHGEPLAADALRQKIEEQLHWKCQIPTYLERVGLD